MAYSIQQFQEITNGKIQGRDNKDLIIKHLHTDSRQIYFPASTCFIAIKSPRRDGHDYIRELYFRGVRSFIISKPIDTNIYPEASFLIVQDVILALQKIAAFHRSKFKIPVVGITGSNGKTIVKEWLFQMVKEDLVVAKSPGSYNSQIGVPLSIWQLNQNHRLGIFEAGISTVGEMNNLSEIIQCDTGILVNIGSAHDAGFQSRQQKLIEKLTLFNRANALIFRIDGGLDIETINNHLPDTVKQITWSLNKSDLGKAHLVISSVSLQSERHQTILEGVWKKEPVSIYLPFVHPADIENAMHCIVWMLHHRYNMHTINERLGKLERVPMRLELQKG
jgi:Alr-MurF fusion protein